MDKIVGFAGVLQLEYIIHHGFCVEWRKLNQDNFSRVSSTLHYWPEPYLLERKFNTQCSQFFWLENENRFFLKGDYNH